MHTNIYIYMGGHIQHHTYLRQIERFKRII